MRNRRGKPLLVVLHNREIVANCVSKVVEGPGWVFAVTKHG